MSRWIDADALIESIKNTADLGGWIGEALYQIKQVAIKYIDSAPTIEPKRGEWIEDYNNTYGRCRMKCSVCGQFSGIGGIKSNQRKPFCPNCGARMKGADDE